VIYLISLFSKTLYQKRPPHANFTLLKFEKMRNLLRYVGIRKKKGISSNGLSIDPSTLQTSFEFMNRKRIEILMRLRIIQWIVIIVLLLIAFVTKTDAQSVSIEPHVQKRPISTMASLRILRSQNQETQLCSSGDYHFS